MAASRNGCFQLLHNGNRTSLKLYPPKGDGRPVSMNLLTRYFEQINLTDYSAKMIKSTIENCREPMEFTVSMQEVQPHNELVFIDISEDGMRVVCTFIPPTSKGKLMGKAGILSAISRSGVKHGIREDVIDKFINSRRYCTGIIMAEGEPVIEGRNATIKYNFSTKLDFSPKMMENGNVDFHHLDIINHVQKGEVLAVMDPMVEGKPGKNVFGVEVLPKKVRNATMKYGKNIHLSEDGTIMYSDVSGHVGLAGDRVFVSNVYEVPADVGVASGNVEYDGSVEVKGNVISGFFVRAEGDIIVDGVVEGATLIAGGQIFLKRGIQGMGKGELIAGGNIVSKFMENCIARAEGDILSEAILHSRVTAVGTIAVKGKKGLITGGSIRSATEISAVSLGSFMETRTEVYIGPDDKIMEEYKNLEVQIEKIKEDQEKYVQIVSICQKKMEMGKATEELIKSAKMAKIQARRLQEENRDKIDRYKYLREQIQNYKPGRVKVQKTAYPGVEIRINSSILPLKKEVDRSRFVLEGADIKVQPLL